MKQLFRCLAAGVIALPLTLSAFTAKAEEIDIVETAVSAGSFATLVKAVQAAGLEERVKFALGQLRKSGVGRRKHRERSLALQCVHKPSRLYGFDKCCEGAR